MAGRGGRGRGRANLSFNVEELGFGRGEALPTAVLQPPPLFPPLTMKPAPLLTGEQYDYLVALKQEFRNTAVESPFYIKSDERRRDVVRYSDKYQMSNSNGDCEITWNPDWRRFPRELRPKSKASTAKPNIAVAKTSKDDQSKITATLNELEKKENTEEAGGGGNEENKEDEEEELSGDEYYDEEEEEETDYIMSYFDNGDGYADDDDDNLDDGPTYWTKNRLRKSFKSCLETRLK